MMCCLANSPAISRSAVILILAYNEMVFQRMERGRLHLHTVRPNAKCGASLTNGMFLLRSVTLSLAQTAENLGNDPQKLLFICGDLLIAGQMGLLSGEGEELKQLNVADPSTPALCPAHERIHMETGEY